MKYSRTYYVAGITLCLLTLAFGGYYEFVNTIFAGILILFFLFEVFIKKSKIQNITDSFWFGCIFLISYAISSFYAVDTGIAFEGFTKKSLFFVWGCLLLLLTKEEKKRLLLWVPYIGTTMVVFCGICYFIPALSEYVFQANRLGGWFQYANTCGGFLLVGSVILLLKEAKYRLDYVALAILMAGILLTGSRSTLLIMILVFFYLLWKMKTWRKWLLIGAGILAVVMVGFLFLTGNTDNIARITTLFTRSSTVYGRLLYNYDGVTQLIKNPFGLGYLGFFFIQNGVQTGLYSVRYVHNDWLQIGLDAGIIPMLLILFILVKNLWNMRKTSSHVIVLLILFLQGFMEFNLEYGVMGLLIMLCLNEQSLSSIKEKTVRTSAIVTCIAIALPLLYMSLPLTLGYFDKSETALNFYPWETNEQLKLLSESNDETEVERLANDILSRNDTCSLAYNAKAILAINNAQYEKAVSYLYASIQHDRFNKDTYDQLEWLLTQVIEQDVVPNPDYYRMEYEALQTLRQKNQNEVSFFGNKIRDKVELIS